MNPHWRPGVGRVIYFSEGVNMRHVLILLAIWLILCGSASAQQGSPSEGRQVYTHTIRQIFGGAQSPDDARVAAMTRAKREVLEKAGTYLESMTVVQEGRLAKDEILALAAGVLRAEIVSEKNFTQGPAFGIEVTARVVVDPEVLQDRVTKLLNDRVAWKRVKELEAREKALLEKMVKLEKENANLKQAAGGAAPAPENLKAEFRNAASGLKAIDYGIMAEMLWDGGKHSDPSKALALLTEAIKLDPKYATAYNNRGLAYSDLGQIPRAIQDFDQAIKLDPKDAEAYYNRGLAYLRLGQYARAIQDFDHAIRLDPKFAQAYNNRGACLSSSQKFGSWMPGRGNSVPDGRVWWLRSGQK